MAYIERESAIKSLLNDCLGQVSYSREDAADCIFWLDTADVVPVRHGRWIAPFLSDGGNMCAECSNCHRIRIFDDYCSACEIGCTWKPNYCPNCGAKMDLEG